MIHQIRHQFGYNILALLAMILFASPTRAQMWDDNYGWPHTDGEIRGLCVYQDKLFAYGLFDVIGGIEAHHIAYWDDTSWHAIPDGPKGYVSCLKEFDGKLFIGGGFDSVGGRPSQFCTWWDGTSFAPPDTTTAGGAHVFGVVNGRLIAGSSSYDWRNYQDTARILREWDGETWNAIDTILKGWVYALTEYRDEIAIVGEIHDPVKHRNSNLFIWDSGNWSDLGQLIWRFDISPSVTLFTLHDSLFLAGTFISVDTIAGTTILVHNGTRWSRLPGELNLIFDTPPSYLAVVDDTLYGIRSGSCDGSGGRGYALCRRTNDTWEKLGSNFGEQPLGLVKYHGSLYAAGRFEFVGDTATNYIARWNGNAWTSVGFKDTDKGLRGSVSRIQKYGLQTVISGYFSAVGTTVASGAADRFDSATDNFVTYKSYRPPFVIDDKLYMRGYYDNFTKVSPVRTLQGTTWVPLGNELLGGVEFIGSFAGQIVAAGHFPARNLSGPWWNVAQWDGSRWNPVGEYNDMTDAPIGTVRCLLDFDSMLVCGGDFVLDRMTRSYNVCSWNGSSWVGMGTGLDSTVWGLQSFNGGVVAIGSFTHDQEGNSIRHLAFWNGSSWSELGGGVDGYVYAVEVRGSSLLVGGLFDTVGNTPAKNLAVWDGNQWSELGGGLNGSVGALLDEGDHLVVGGGFTRAGTTPSSGIAVWYWSPTSVNENNDLKLPNSFSFAQNYPNPFNPTTTISFVLPKTAHVNLRIVNALGQTVRTLVSNNLAVGEHSVTWNGRNDGGEACASGVYFALVDTDTDFASRKMLLLK